MQKNIILDVVNRMPDTIKIDDLVAELHFREKLERGLKDIEKGKIINHNEARNRLSKWLD